MLYIVDAEPNESIAVVRHRNRYITETQVLAKSRRVVNCFACKHYTGSLELCCIDKGNMRRKKPSGYCDEGEEL